MGIKMEVINQSSQEDSEKMSKQLIENDELIIEENTIYEIDLECYHCLQEKEKRKNN